MKDAASTAEAGVLTEWLVKVGRDRDRQAFAALFQHYAPRLKTYLRKLGCDDAQAEDLVQEAMLAIWRKAESFDPAKASAGTWIFTVARNLRVDRLRREARIEFDPDDPLLVQDQSAGADDQLAQRQSDDQLRQALHGLPGDQATVVEMSFYQECPHTEIADRLGIPLGTVKSRLRLAMSRLRSALGDDVR